jgi:hypothetical protein
MSPGGFEKHWGTTPVGFGGILQRHRKRAAGRLLTKLEKIARKLNLLCQTVVTTVGYTFPHGSAP